MKDKDCIRDKNGLCVEIKLSWCLQDVLEQAENNGTSLTRKQASSVLEACLYDHDFSGRWVNWDVINYHIDKVLEESEEIC